MLRPLALCFLTGALAAIAHANLDVSTFDASVPPQQDFYRHVNGLWLTTTPIPAQHPGWGTVMELREANAQALRILCERASAVADQGTPAERIVGDFYASGVDDATIAENGADPLRFEFNRIDAVQSAADVLLEIGHLQSLGVDVGFGFTSVIDAHDTHRQMAVLEQGGLGLPDRDYYLRTEDQAKRDEYAAHITRIFALLGIGDDAAPAQVAAILRIETALAQASSTRVALRDPVANYRDLSLDELAALAPGLDWKGYFARTGAPGFADVDVAQAPFIAAFARLLPATPVADWRAYLRWHFIHQYAPYLSDSFVAEDFAFYGRFLNGVQEIQPRWRRAVATVDASVGEALGQLYVAANFPPESKERMVQLVGRLRAALRARLQTVPWMDEPTRQRALAKLDLLGVKVGYPDRWRDYTGLVVDRGPYVLNVLKARAWEYRRGLRKIGQAPDPTEWSMTAPTVNAYYSRLRNEIVFPAGILQPPLFDPAADDAVNYGAIGAVIGHEMTHGFDDQGRKFDGHGNLVDWWTPESQTRFRNRAALIVRQFDGYPVKPGLHVDGALTEGENIADLGGIRIAYAALEQALGDRTHPAIDGFTPEQRFFLSYATVRRWKYRPAALENLIRTDPHSPAEFRVNGPLSNLEEFARAFSVPDGAPMRRAAADRVEIW